MRKTTKFLMSLLVFAAATMSGQIVRANKLSPDEKDFTDNVHPYPDTDFLPTHASDGYHAHFGKDDTAAFTHFTKNCIYERGSITAYPSSYLEFCEIREGNYAQQCTSNAYKMGIWCDPPKPLKKAKFCQESFIQQRFYNIKTPNKRWWSFLTSLFSPQCEQPTSNKNCVFGRVNKELIGDTRKWCNTNYEMPGLNPVTTCYQK